MSKKRYSWDEKKIKKYIKAGCVKGKRHKAWLGIQLHSMPA